ncbi:hypothetical protein PANO111632_02705 [Paracoccus nototheniae]|uniref:Uncharacterized protein n=1 Tax=Paracoccus nototheniae TaxID=2489002 RepID=A0ABW4DWP4_9RHOB|nr:hypothetical protein [Paracoccus nototheniae]
MTNLDATICRRLWASVALQALSYHRRKIQAAARGQGILYFGSDKVYIGTLEHEIASATAYLDSDDFGIVCERAGADPKLAEAIDYLVNARERISMKSVMEAAA